MPERNIYIYIAVMAGVTYLIRVLPLTLLRRPIRNRFLRSFLYYVPYVTLSVMTFPAILYTAKNPVAGTAALCVALLLAWFRRSLITVAAGASLAALLVGLLEGTEVGGTAGETF